MGPRLKVWPSDAHGHTRGCACPFGVMKEPSGWMPNGESLSRAGGPRFGSAPVGTAAFKGVDTSECV